MSAMNPVRSLALFALRNFRGDVAVMVFKSRLKWRSNGVNYKGMSLIEIVVSMLVLAVAALGVASTISLVNSKQMRSAGGGSLDLQAASFARQTLEELKNAVTTDTAGAGARLLDVSYDSPCQADAGEICGTKNPPYTEYSETGTLPAGSDLVTKSSARSRVYRVWDISSGTKTAGTDVAYKKVTVVVDWTD